MKTHHIAFIAGLSLTLLSTHALASQSSEAKADFSKAYQTYLSAVKINQNVKQAAERAYMLGQNVYAKSSDNIANLAINYAKALENPAYKNVEIRYNLYKKAYAILVKNHGDESPNTIDALLGIAKNTQLDKEAAKYLTRAVDIAQAQNMPKFVADMKFTAASILSQKFVSNYYRKAKNYLIEADEYYQANLPENSLERIKSDFLMASFAQGSHKYDEAIERLNRIVTVFDNSLNYDHSAELSAHSKLIELYEQQGKSEHATKHCIAIAKMVPWKESQEQKPLYRVNPKYPANKISQSRDGSVQMEFEVDTAGFVKDIRVLDSFGGITFEKEAMAAVKKWRYAPKFENGKPVVATSQVQLNFKIKH